MLNFTIIFSKLIYYYTLKNTEFVIEIDIRNI